MFLSKRLVYWLLVGSRGGKNRARILQILKEKPRNMKQIADSTGLHYKSVQHHIDLMVKHGLVTAAGERYGKIYFVSQDMEEMWSEFPECFGKK